MLDWRWFTAGVALGGSTNFPRPFCQEGCDLREQAKWKLERATKVAMAAKRWDAAGVASFAQAEVLGSDDAIVAAGALMLHQVRWVSWCRDGHMQYIYTIVSTFCIHARGFTQYIAYVLSSCASELINPFILEFPRKCTNVSG